VTADTLHTLSRILSLHGKCCERGGKAADRFRFSSSWHHTRRAVRLAAMHHRILVAMLPHSELTQLLLRRVS
jgi:hypothetical protein